MKPHKHCELIKAWADGAELQTFLRGEWVDEPLPCFFPDNEYRIKPRTVKREGWVNIHKPHLPNALQYAIIHLSEAAARHNALGEPIATVKVEWTEEVK